ncbi:MAG TPA: cytochrome c [Candidatus Polarisedimenticolaceae bacterium]|nr:cytochrome c [Candidatus Polarisedimenticolaceae bacterium]
MKAMRILLAVCVLGVLAAATAAYAADEAGATGMDLYTKKCAMCHGKDGVAGPMAKGSANFNDPAWQKTATVESIEKVTADGKGKMPKYADKLKPEEIKAIATHVKTLK